MKIKEILSRDDIRFGDVVYDRTVDKHFMLACSFVKSDTFACVIDLECGVALSDDTAVGNSIKFWEKFFRDADVELVDEYKAVRETEEEDDDK